MAAQRVSEKEIARERVEHLFELAKEVFSQNPVLAKRYVFLARKIGMRYKVRIPLQYRRLICRHCKSFILPGVNCRVRIKQRREPHVVITCLECDGKMRVLLKG